MAVFSTLIHTGLYFAARDLANSISCVAAAICRYPSSSLGNSLYQAWKQGCVSQKGFSSPSTLLTTFLPPICSSLPPSWPLCFLHMLAPRTSIFFLTFTYASLLMQWSCSLSFQLPPSIRKKCNPSSFLQLSPTFHSIKETGRQCCPCYTSLGKYYLTENPQERSKSLKLRGDSLLSSMFRAPFLQAHHLQHLPSIGTLAGVRSSDFKGHITGSLKSLWDCPTPEANQEGMPRNPALTSCLPPKPLPDWRSIPLPVSGH